VTGGLHCRAAGRCTVNTKEGSGRNYRLLQELMKGNSERFADANKTAVTSVRSWDCQFHLRC
jgi:hypothetical protein